MYSWSDIFIYSEVAPLIFSQYLFLVLLTAVLGIYAAIYNQLKVRNLFLFAFSLFFYYKCGGLYFWLLIISTIVDYTAGRTIYKSEHKPTRRTWLIVSVVINLGLLAFFKYSYFIVDQINYWFNTNLVAVNHFANLANYISGTNHDITSIILPVGISFYTFQTMSYTIDIYRGELEPTKNILDFGFFVSFFPQLVAGPIVRAKEFIPQIYQKYELTRAQFGRAIFLIINGLIKKMLISDYISVNFVDRVFDSPQIYGWFENLFAVYGYSIQIYCDFSGYSDMAIGLALLLGFKLNDNFNSPYKSTSITDFWRRWHISLSSWLRDYLYIPLGGNRKGKVRTYINLSITMLLGGLWHGAATRFIIWGALHGVALAIDKAWKEFVGWPKNKTQLTKFLSGVLTFHFVAFCWIYFRAKDVDTVNIILSKITSFNVTWAEIVEKVIAYRAVLSIILIGFAIHWLPAKLKENIRLTFTKMPDLAVSFIIAVVIIGLYQIASSGVQPFIYFQF